MAAVPLSQSHSATGRAGSMTDSNAAIAAASSAANSVNSSPHQTLQHVQHHHQQQPQQLPPPPPNLHLHGLPLGTPISLDLAKRDHPHFRASITSFEADLDSLQKWMEGLGKGVKEYITELSRANDATYGMIAKMKGRSKVGLLDGTVVGTFEDALSTICGLKAKMTETLTSDLLQPLLKYIREDIKEMRDYRKIHDKVLEKYDAALVRYAGLNVTSKNNKEKDPSVAKEEAFILFEARKAYIHSAIEYAYRIMVFKNSLEMLIVDRLMLALSAHSAYFETASDLFIGIKPSMDSLKNRLEQARLTLPTAVEIESRKRKLEEEAIRLASPSSLPDLTSHSDAHHLQGPPPMTRTGSFAATPGNVVSPNWSSINMMSLAAAACAGATDREGHLFIRRGKNWSRIYVSITQNQLWMYESDLTATVVNPNGNGGGGNTPSSDARRKGSGVVVTGPVSVLLIGARIDRAAERKWCFEFFTQRRTLLFQAETEHEMYEWIGVLEASKAKSLEVTQQPPSAEEELVGRTVVAPDDFDEEEEDDEGVIIVQTQAVQEAKGVKGADPVIGDVRYPDPSWDKKDKELHKLLKSIPKTDYVIDAYVTALQRDILIQGKIYLTQNRIAFYSNILGFVNLLVIPLTTIKSIIKVKSGPFHSTINIETVDGDLHSFKSFVNMEEKVFKSLKMAWENANANFAATSLTNGAAAATATSTTMPANVASTPYAQLERMNTQQLFDAIFNINHKLDERERKGKGAVAAAVDGAAGLQPPAADMGATDVEGGVGDELPPGVTPPAGEVKCGCDSHLEKVEIVVTVPCSARQLYNLMFGGGADTTTLFEKYHKARGESGRVTGTWVEPAPAGMVVSGIGEFAAGAIAARESKWMMPFNNPIVKVKEARVDEVAYLLRRQEYFSYVVECRSMTPEVLYGDNFSPTTRHCITWLTRDTCKLHISTGIKFFKSPMIKSLIKSEGAKGLRQGALDLVDRIKSEVDVMNSRSGRVVASAAGAADGSEERAEAPGAAPVASSRVDDEGILPFGLSKNVYVQWGLMGLVVWMLLWNSISWLFLSRKGGAATCVRIERPTASIDFGSAFTMDGPTHQAAVLAFLKTHFIEPVDADKANITFPATLTPREDTEGGIQHYSHASNRDVFANLQALRDGLAEAREDARRMMRWIDAAERAVIVAEFWNWVEDGVGTCRGGVVGVGKAIGGCRGVQKLGAEVARRRN